ncbi:hypothetical protein Tco_0169212 [Tanacetum coccineum]
MCTLVGALAQVGPDEREARSKAGLEVEIGQQSHAYEGAEIHQMCAALEDAGDQEKLRGYWEDLGSIGSRVGGDDELSGRGGGGADKNPIRLLFHLSTRQRANAQQEGWAPGIGRAIEIKSTMAERGVHRSRMWGLRERSGDARGEWEHSD